MPYPPINYCCPKCNLIVDRCLAWYHPPDDGQYHYKCLPDDYKRSLGHSPNYDGDNRIFKNNAS
jgi:hypothetical protein